MMIWTRLSLSLSLSKIAQDQENPPDRKVLLAMLKAFSSDALLPELINLERLERRYSG